MIKKNIFSIVTALIILYLSLTGSEKFDSITLWDMPGIDKIVHFLMYFFFMSVIVFENRNNINNRSRLYLLGLVPVFYGAFMELFQILLTISRSGSLYDFLSNTTGVLICVLLCLVIKPVRNILFR